MRVGVLGSTQVWRDDTSGSGPVVAAGPAAVAAGPAGPAAVAAGPAASPAGTAGTVGGSRLRALLAMLLLAAGRNVPVPRLVDGLYGDDPPRGVGNALQSQVSRLRRAVPGLPVEFHPAGYRLAVDPDRVDAHRFERLAGQGRQT